MTRRFLKHQNTLRRAAVALVVPAAMWAGGAYADFDAGTRVLSVTPASPGRYDVAGIAIDELVNPACTLALASGRCVFSCGPGSIRCEGGTADLPNGYYELFDLPTDENGLIWLQVFAEGHVAMVTPIAPEPLPDAARWGVMNTYCCPGMRSTFEVEIDGVKKKSSNSTCSFDRAWEPSWEGWGRAPSAPFEVDADSELETQSVVNEECQTYSDSFQTQLTPGTCVLYSLRAVNGLPEMFEEEVPCDSLP